MPEPHAESSDCVEVPQMKLVHALSTRWPWQLVVGASHTGAEANDDGQSLATLQHDPVAALQQWLFKQLRPAWHWFDPVHAPPGGWRATQVPDGAPWHHEPALHAPSLAQVVGHASGFWLGAALHAWLGKPCAEQ